MGRRKQQHHRRRLAVNPVSTLIESVEVVDLIERVAGGWYEIASAGGEVRMEVRECHEAVKISVNDHGFHRDDPGTREVFRLWPSKFNAVLLVATRTDLQTGRYRVTAERITVESRGVFDLRAHLRGQMENPPGSASWDDWPVQGGGATIVADWSRWVDRLGTFKSS